jgi:POLQ-like helicase
MVGRAGRAGLVAENVGESILIVNEKQVDKTKINDLIMGPMTICHSSLNANDFKSIRILILTLIDLKLIRNGLDICSFFEQTLFSMQNKDDHLLFILSSINYLIENKFIVVTRTTTSSTIAKLDENLFETKHDLIDHEFKITKLGCASIKSGVDLDLIERLYCDLNVGLKHMILSTNLHLLYLCTPYDLANAITTIDYDIYARKVLCCIVLRKLTFFFKL